MLKTICFLILCIAFYSCEAQTKENSKNKDKNDISNYQNEILLEEEMRVTTDKAVLLIQNKNYTEFKKLIVDDVAKNVSEYQIIQIVDQINEIFKTEGVPKGNQNILPGLNVSLNGNDTIFVNNIMYNFKPINNNKKVLTFSFLKKYGTDKIIGVNLNINPLSSANVKPSIEQIEKFDFKTSDISKFRIYYDEGVDKKTKFKNEIGYFAVEGDLNTLKSSGISPIIETVFADLKQSKFESAKPFNATIDIEENTRFIQAEFSFVNHPYSILIYLPIKNGGAYENKIIVRQREYVNLGYEFTLTQDDYHKIKKQFPKIAKLKLENFYLDKP